MTTTRLPRGRAGFTLIEILVSLVLLAVLAAAVFPVVTQQIGAADAPALANDLSAIKTGLETFNANTGTFPGDLEDLVYKPTTAEHTILAGTYTDKEIRGWNGPYVEIFMQNPAGTLNPSPISNGFGSTVNRLFCVDADAGDVEPEDVSCEKNVGHYVAVNLTGFSLESFLKLNDVVDPSEDDSNFSTPQRRQRGKLRCEEDTDDATQCANVYYLASPYVKR